MTEPEITSIHFVGSVCLRSTEETFKTICSTIPPQKLKRLPDGEPGKRQYFAGWQLALFRHYPALLHEGLEPSTPTEFNDPQEVDDILSSLSDLETGYDEAALQSYCTFKGLKGEGIIPEHVRFQVSLPTPASVVAQMINSSLVAQVEPLYGAALLRALDRIHEAIPAHELAIQWDLPLEIAMLEGAELRGIPATAWFKPMFDRIVDRLVKLGEAVRPGAELGYHFCYGDSGHKHFKEPKDLRIVAELASAVLERCRRRVDWVHMPVPVERVDDAYFEPLNTLALRLRQGPSELILGLVHHGDLQDTQRRQAVARKFVPSFGVATECGLGRTPPEQLKDILKICDAV